MINEDLQNAVMYEELWASTPNLDKNTLSESFNNVTMTFNTEEGTVEVVSGLLNDNHKPMFEWKMTPATGEIVEISRAKDGSLETTVNKDVDPAELTTGTATTAGGSLNKLLSDPSVLELEWNEAEAQRDIAFKIMYFFIALVIVTFLTLYAYFTIVQKSEQQARARAMRKKQGLMDDDVAAPMESTSFVDFLSGSFDANEIAQPRTAPRVLNPTMKSAVNTGAQAVAIGLGMGTSAFYAQSNKKTIAKKHSDSGFGSSNLATLENKGSYSGAELDHFEFDGDHPDTELLAKTADK